MILVHLMGINNEKKRVMVLQHDNFSEIPSAKAYMGNTLTEKRQSEHCSYKLPLNIWKLSLIPNLVSKIP